MCASAYTGCFENTTGFWQETAIRRKSNVTATSTVSNKSCHSTKVQPFSCGIVCSFFLLVSEASMTTLKKKKLHFLQFDAWCRLKDLYYVVNIALRSWKVGLFYRIVKGFTEADEACDAIFNIKSYTVMSFVKSHVEAMSTFCKLTIDGAYTSDLVFIWSYARCQHNLISFFFLFLPFFFLLLLWS